MSSVSPIRPVEFGTWSSELAAWQSSLAGRNLSHETCELYARHLRYLVSWAEAQGVTNPLAMSGRMLSAYLADRASRPGKRKGAPISPSTLATEYRSLVQFYKWLADEEEVASPMAKIKAPTVPVTHREILSDDDLRRLLDACKGSRDPFNDRRDVAVLRVLLDSGVRAGELLGLTLADVDLVGQTLLVHGKGRKTRRVVFGHRTAEALRRYLRTRATQRDAGLDALWLQGIPHRGPLTRNGLRMMLDRRGAKAGVDDVYPHRFRHTSFDAFVDAGGEGGDAMTLYGWSSRSMLDHYAASSAERRALKAGKRISAGDRI